MLTGIKRIVSSAKVQLSAGAVATAFVALVTAPGDFASKQDLWRDFLYASFGLVAAVVLGWAHEDAASNSNPNASPPPTPTTSPRASSPVPVLTGAMTVPNNVPVWTSVPPTAGATTPTPVKPVIPSQAQILTSAINALTVEVRKLQQQRSATPPPPQSPPPSETERA